MSYVLTNPNNIDRYCDIIFYNKPLRVVVTDFQHLKYILPNHISRDEPIL